VCPRARVYVVIYMFVCLPGEHGSGRGAGARARFPFVLLSRCWTAADGRVCRGREQGGSVRPARAVRMPVASALALSITPLTSKPETAVWEPVAARRHGSLFPRRVLSISVLRVGLVTLAAGRGAERISMGVVRCQQPCGRGSGREHPDSAGWGTHVHVCGRREGDWAGCPAETGLTRAPLKLCKCNSLFQTEWECRRPSTSVLAPAAGWFARCGATRGAAPVAWLTQPGRGSGSCFCETVQTDGLDAPVLWLGSLHEQGAGTGRTPGPSPPSPVGVRGTPGGKHPPEGFIETYSAPRVPPHPAFKAASLKCESLQYLVLKECWALLPFPSARACLVQLVKEERRSASERCRDRVAASPVILSRTKTLLEHRRALNAKAQSRRHLGKGALPLPGTAESRNPKRVLHRENHLGKLVGSDGEKKCQGILF